MVVRQVLRQAWERLRRIGFGRRLVLALGTASFLAGMALVVMGVASLSGGGSERSVSRVVDLGTDEGAAYAFRTTSTPSPTPGPSPSPSPSQSPTLAPTPPLAEASYRMIIEEIGVDAPVLTFGLDENAVPEVPTNKDDIAWYDFSAEPGTGSNAVFAGHVTWFGPGVFFDLNQLEVGDIVRLESEDGVTLEYRVSSSFAVDPNDPDSLTVMRPTEEDVITLITCAGTFFPTDDAISGGDYTLRLIVRADLIGSPTSDTVETSTS